MAKKSSIEWTDMTWNPVTGCTKVSPGCKHCYAEQTHDDVFDRLGKLDDEPLSAVQLNPLLVLGREAPVADGFFRYYWLQAPAQHPYSVRELPGFSEDWLRSEGTITSLAHLKW